MNLLGQGPGSGKEAKCWRYISADFDREQPYHQQGNLSRLRFPKICISICRSRRRRHTSCCDSCYAALTSLVWPHKCTVLQMPSQKQFQNLCSWGVAFVCLLSTNSIFALHEWVSFNDERNTPIFCTMGGWLMYGVLDVSCGEMYHYVVQCICSYNSAVQYWSSGCSSFTHKACHVTVSSGWGGACISSPGRTAHWIPVKILFPNENC